MVAGETGKTAMLRQVVAVTKTGTIHATVVVIADGGSRTNNSSDGEEIGGGSDSSDGDYKTSGYKSRQYYQQRLQQQHRTRDHVTAYTSQTKMKRNYEYHSTQQRDKFKRFTSIITISNIDYTESTETQVQTPNNPGRKSLSYCQEFEIKMSKFLSGCKRIKTKREYLLDNDFSVLENHKSPYGLTSDLSPVIDVFIFDGITVQAIRP
ncbi:Hypothetical predicted protein [Octopus vulgaris]|uniref:Uncharacterized protein n=1 Tax=Octopus vulgaris TaxID=6645 RepID=A0AA36APF3_OCTVU|nr:Hypothetical predicted protein [Octopus vulgaris]